MLSHSAGPLYDPTEHRAAVQKADEEPGAIPPPQPPLHEFWSLGQLPAKPPVAPSDPVISGEWQKRLLQECAPLLNTHGVTGEVRERQGGVI